MASLGAEHSPDDALFVGVAQLPDYNAGFVGSTAHSRSSDAIIWQEKAMYSKINFELNR